MRSFLRVVRDVALLLSRILMGVVLLAHGWHRWQVMGIAKEVSLLDGAGIGNATTIVWIVVGFEIVGGILLVFGLATPLVGLGIVVLNLATIVLLRSEEFYAHEQGWEYNAVQAAVGLLLLAHGSGRAGLDNLFLRPQHDGDELIVDESDADRIHPQAF
ncbi:DoxX family protein [Tessaracoccus antarcticus]|uniref:DoxX family protein n=1 Tax=Tessaracoccus antarcticus TaxID=2479848 RepID=A0A3M0GAJ3_9ACTN|nr:DoxX family protein [Tessaracoccus antarcticus]RMB61990.1 DoxX family protein [Tessaracoccus antarcticus]